MKHLLIISLLFAITFHASAWKTKKKPTPTPAILKQYPFTMTEAEYNKIASIGKKEYIYPKQYICISKNIMGYSAKLCFLREDQNIKKIMFHIPLKKEKNPQEYVRQFTKLKRLLIKKYGKPTSDKSDYNKDTSSRQLRKYKKKMNGKGLALSDGNLEYISLWKKDKFTVELKCYKNRRVRTSKQCTYIDLSYIAPKNKPIPVKVATTNKKADSLAEL